jgi:hypothetical protein
MTKYILVLTSFYYLLASSQALYITKKVPESLAVNLPGFAKFIPNFDNTDNHLVITSFSGIPFSTDNVYFLPNISKVDPTFPKFQALPNKNLVWPNQPNYHDSSLIDAKIDPFGGIIVPFGFLVPSKGRGGLYYYPFTSQDRSAVSPSPQPINLASDNEENIDWFYHRAKLVDLNGDGTKDILTCRTHKPIFGSTLTELVSFVFDPTTKGFKEHVIMKSACDVFFDTADIDKDGRFEIFSAGFFISQLNVIYSTDPNNSFLNGNVEVRRIDEKAGQLFEVIIADLDNQGKIYSTTIPISTRSF